MSNTCLRLAAGLFLIQNLAFAAPGLELPGSLPESNAPIGESNAHSSILAPLTDIPPEAAGTVETAVSLSSVAPPSAEVLPGWQTVLTPPALLKGELPLPANVDAIIAQPGYQSVLLKYSGVASLMLLLFVYWIVRLRREIFARRRSEADLAKLYTNMSLGFALHQVLRDRNGKIIDYRYLDINPAFENMTGLLRATCVGKTVKQLLPHTGCPWITSFDELDAGGEARHFENHVAALERWFAIDSYKAAPDQFVVLVQDITERKRAELALKRSERRFRLSQNYGGVGIWEADLLTGKQYWSKFVTAELGFPKKSPRSWDDFIAVVVPEDRPALIQATQRHIDDGCKFDVEYRILASDGRRRWMRSVGQVERNSVGKPVKMRGIIQDISDRKVVEEKLRMSARVFSDAHEGIVITDVDGQIIDVNAAFSDITGYSRDEVIGENPRLLKSDKHPVEFYADLWQQLSDEGHWQGEIWNRRKDGEIYAELLTISALRDQDGAVINFIGLFSDITESKRQQQELEVLAHYDPLTQLPNRALFSDRFAQAIAHSKRSEMLLAVCYLDLDGFKQVNDNLGHEAGDLLLVQVAKRIKQNLREGDTVCRLGGDEFVILFENVQSLRQCEDALTRIHNSLAEPFDLDGSEARIAASSGVTLYPLDNEEPDTLLRHADQAMYQAKQAGRNCFRVYEHLTLDQPVAVTRPSRLEQALVDVEKALEQGQFCMHYQPRVNIRTGEVVGVEALIRWQHPERGLLAPSEFLPLIEGSPLEIEVSNWSLRQVFRQLQSWQDAGLTLHASVNVSPKYLQWQDFVPNLHRLLAEHPQISSRQLELEILESSVLDDLISVGEILNQCYYELGVQCELDDFGTGYSSLTHLRHLTISAVKIDQSFVRGMIDNPDDLSIVEGVIALAKAFKREVIAEGVEDIEHGVFLIELGCHIAQGFCIARPMPAADVQDWVISYRTHPAWLNHIQSPRSAEQTQLTLLKLQQQYWLRRLEEYLRAPHDANCRWPAVSQKRSHLRKWLDRLGAETGVDRRLLSKLEQGQARQFMLAAQLLQQHQQGQKTLGSEAYQQLLAANLDVIQTLEQLEPKN